MNQRRVTHTYTSSISGVNYRAFYHYIEGRPEKVGPSMGECEPEEAAEVEILTITLQGENRPITLEANEEETLIGEILDNHTYDPEHYEEEY